MNYDSHFQTKLNTLNEDQYSVPEYKELVRLCWQETKRDFAHLLDLCRQMADINDDLPKFTWGNLTLMDPQRSPTRNESADKEETGFPDLDDFHARTAAWKDVFQAIQDEYHFDHTCFTLRAGIHPPGDVAATLLDFRDTYGWRLALPIIEDSPEFMIDLAAECVSKLRSMEYSIERYLPGTTRRNGRRVKMMASANYDQLLRELKIAYLDPQTRGSAWVLMVSWGKDSMLMTKAAIQMIDSLPEHQRFRDVYVCYADTGLEAPVIYAHISENAEELAVYCEARKLPVKVIRSQAEIDQRFFAMMIGYGYTPPTRLNRWCTTRLKVSPNEAQLARLCIQYDGVIILLGTREAESSARKASIAKNTDGENRYNPKVGAIKQLRYQPIRYFSTKAVWEGLQRNGGLSWGNGYARLFQLYKDSSGECPLVSTGSSVAGCAGAGGRWGCWTCTLVKDDKSMRNFIRNGYAWMKPLYDYRAFIIDLAKKASMRESHMIERRTGKIRETGTIGGFNKKARRLLFDELMKLRETIAATKPADVVYDVISDAEIEQIQRYWFHLDNIQIWDVKAPQQISLAL